MAVSNQTLLTFRSLHPSERAKSVSWVAFVHVMTEVGFMARVTDVSDYSFEPSELSPWSAMGKIGFYKPHSEPKYRNWRLLGMGKRMGKHFGGSADTFVVYRSMEGLVERIRDQRPSERARGKRRAVSIPEEDSAEKRLRQRKNFDDEEQF